MNTNSLLVATLLVLGGGLSMLSAEPVDIRSFPGRNSDVIKTEVQPKNILWQAELGENMKVAVQLNNVTAVALHPYMLNGVTKVTEVTIDTKGSHAIRFYHIHKSEKASLSTDPQATLGSAKKSANSSATQQSEANQLPSIKFPEGVYAHTIEYQIGSMEDLEKIYNSLIKAIQRISSPASETLKLDPQ